VPDDAEAELDPEVSVELLLDNVEEEADDDESELAEDTEEVEAEDAELAEEEDMEYVTVIWTESM
jgi:hypothetical protein